MSTLGGSRGERNAKPKFSALDINRMYKNSRGESTEPSTQKSQVPRKHGMQSLGKVPSARRPPANLPSLKAEISSPSPGNLVSPTVQEVNKNNASFTLGSSGNHNLKTKSSNTIIGNKSYNSSNNSSGSASVVGFGSKLINNSSASTFGTTSGSIEQKRSSSLLSNQVNNPQAAAITWSAVTTGAENSNKSGSAAGKNTAPPLYQSPQFQHEFPTLDGTVGGVASGGCGVSNKKDYHTQHFQSQPQQPSLPSQHYQQKANDSQRGEHHGNRHPADHQTRHSSHHNHKDGDVVNEIAADDLSDSQEVSLRPQTDSSAWLMQQEKTAKNSMENLSNSQVQAPQNGSSASVPLPILALMPPFMQRNTQLPSASTGGRSKTPPNYQNGIGHNHGFRGKEGTSQTNTLTGRQQRSAPLQNVTTANSNMRSSTASPSLGKQMFNNEYNSRKEKEFVIEPELVQMQRPIIREEDLERLNAIAKDDSWTKQDEIDYNKKLTFSDDDSHDEDACAQDSDRPFDNRKTPLSNYGNNKGWQRNTKESRNSSDRERDKSNDREREVESRPPNGMRNNVIAGGTIPLDASVYERMKQRKEEEERREMERKQNAAKKLQELEMKLNSKKISLSDSQEDSMESNRVEDHAQPQMRRSTNRGSEYERNQRDIRSGGDFIRSNNNSTTAGAAKSIFSGHFQSNLPPRFQRQQQLQAQHGGNPNANDSSSTRSITASGSTDKSATPGYDSGRYIQRSLGPRNEYRDSSGGGGFMRLGGFGRNRNDMDRSDERYRGRGDEYMRNNSQNQLSRSISDTSQRKTSLSSNDDSIKYSGSDVKESGGNGSFVTSWAAETDAELKRHRVESFSSSNSHESIPIKILQRPHAQKSFSEEDDGPQWNLHSHHDNEEDQIHTVPTQILQRSESNDSKNVALTKLEDNSDEVESNPQSVADLTKDNETADCPSSSADKIMPLKKETTCHAASAAEEEPNDEAQKLGSSYSKDQKATSSRVGTGRERDKDRDRDRGSHGRVYGNSSSYRGSRDSNWNNRSNTTRSSRYQSSNEVPISSENEQSADIEEENYGTNSKRQEGSVKSSRKDHGRRSDERSNKEGFAPRGEPSRRGRGGGNNVGDRSQANASFRRSSDTRGSSNQSRFYIRNTHDEQKTDQNRSVEPKVNENQQETDKTKQNQIALSAGLTNKVKETNQPSAGNKNVTTVSHPKKLNEGEKKNVAGALGGTSASSGRKDGNKLDESITEREKKQSKDSNTSSASHTQQRTNSSSHSTGHRGSASLNTTIPKKTDTPMISQSFSTNTSNISKINQQHTQNAAKAPPGLGTKTSSSSSNSINSNLNNNNTQNHQTQSSADMQKSTHQRSNVMENEKVKTVVITGDKSVNANKLLDGAPVNTIIFENTNYKQQAQAAAASSTRSESLVVPSVSTSATVNASSDDNLSNALSQMTFTNANEGNKPAVTASDYEKDMKLGFNFSDASETFSGTKIGAEAENTTQQPSVTSVGQQQQQAQNIISTAELNMKIASVKKVWENVAPIQTESNTTLQQQQPQQQQLQHQVAQPMEVVDPSGHISAAASFAAAAAAVAASQQQQQQHQQQQQQQQHIPHYAVTAVHMHQHQNLSSPGQASNAYGAHNSPFDGAQMEQQFGQNSNIVVGSDETTVVYSSPQQHQHVAGQQLKHQQDIKQNSAAKQQQHASSIGMSPPPSLQQQQHQQTSTQMHAAPQQYYQASPQYSGIPTIPSPPAVVFNSSQIPPPPSQGGMYAPFHSLDHSNRSQYSAPTAHSYPGHYNAAAAAAAGGPFNAYTLQTPPNLATAPAPDMYPSLTSQFRMGGGPNPFGNPNSPQINSANAATVAIISSNSNSLMSSVGSVKPPPSSQQLGTIGSKASSGGGPYANAAQQYMNLYPGPPQHPQSGPPGAHQLQTNNFYSNSSGGPTAPPYYGGPPPPQGAGGGAQNYSLAAAAASLYGGHQGGPPGSNGPQGPQSQHTISNFNAQFMNSPLLTAAAISQYRGGPTPQQAAAAAYMKSNQGHLQDSMSRQLKSPLGADVSLNLAKQVQSQPSPPHLKNYGNWEMQNQVIQQQSQQQQQVTQGRGGVAVNAQNINANSRSASGVGGNIQNCQQQGSNPNMSNVNNGGNAMIQGRYPTPIQRPTNYPQHPQGGNQQQQQQSQPSQRASGIRQSNNPTNMQSGSGGPNAVMNNNNSGSANNNVNNGHNNAGQGNQMNKTPYYTNNPNSGGTNRANHG